MNRHRTGVDQQAVQLHLLARGLRIAGRHAEAADHYRKAIRLQPRVAAHHVGLGMALRAAGRANEALAAYRRAAELDPAVAEVHHNLGNLLLWRGDVAGAERCYLRALGLNPHLAEAHFELGNIAVGKGDDGAGAAHYRRATAARADYAAAWHALADAERRRGARQDAIVAFEHALALDERPPAWTNLGILLREVGRHEHAHFALERAIELSPDLADAWLTLGTVHHDRNEWTAASACYARAIELRPEMALAHLNLGIVHYRNGRIAAGFAATERALELDGGLHQACNNLGTLHMAYWDAEAAMQWLRRAVEIKPDYHEALSNRCMTANYVDGMEPDELFVLHLDYGRQLAAAIPSAPARPQAGHGARRLRIGYVSPDLRRHSVAYFMEPLLTHHDRSAFEVVAYYNYAAEDAVSARLRALCDAWVPTIGLDDQAMAERIRADGIDILVDLAGHTHGNRLPVFARRPAPVQATWLGYLTTTGLAAIDYRITDAQVDPPGAEPPAVEAPLRLPGCYVCYRPEPDAPEVGPLPAATNGYLSFGSFNNPTKLSPACIALWSAVLAAVPGSRLVLKNRNLADPAMRALLAGRFADHGIEASRLELNEWQEDTVGHLAAYGQVDIALDTWPYNGVTTTCEALWMGVPVVSRVGATHASRQGRTLLAAIGLDHLARDSDAKFVRACQMLANDLAGLASLRAGMRQRLRASPLLDGARFARDVEAAYREMWPSSCAGDSSTASGHDHGAKGPLNAAAQRFGL